MIFFLLFFLKIFSFIHGDCLEFSNDSLINQCLIIESEKSNIDYYYHECLQCKIKTLIPIENIFFEKDNQCLTIELQCIQLKFPTEEFFEDFFQNHQHYLYELFFKTNQIDQNTLHIILEEYTLDEINADYIEKYFFIQYQAYRVLFFEIHIQENQLIKIHQNLINLTRLAIKLIIICGEKYQFNKTIFLIYNQKIFLESKENFCSTILIPSLIISSTISISTSSTIEILPISNEKSKDIILILILLTGFLLCLLISLLFYCFKYLKYRYKRLSKHYDTISEISISQDITPLTPNENPKLSLKSKQQKRGMRAIQLLEDDV